MKICARRVVWKLVSLAGAIASIALFGLAAEAAPPGQGGQAKTYNNISFRLGDLSFADDYVRFTAAAGTKGDHANPAHALRVPDYDEPTGYVSLGDAQPNLPEGQLVLEFTDNALVDGPGDDLAIFEIGPMGEATDVYISATGRDRDWIYVGRALGGARTLDISGYAEPGVQYRFVLLCDVANGVSNADSVRNGWAGPDIDAVGAINSVAVAESCTIRFRCLPFRDEQGVRHVSAGKSLGCWIEYDNPDGQDVMVSVRVNDETLLFATPSNASAVNVSWEPQQPGPYVMRAWVEYPDGTVCRAHQTLVVDPGP